MNKENNCICLALCEGRHEIPGAIDGAIFDGELDPTDIVGINQLAYSKLEPFKGCKLELYVTGLTVALISVLNVSRTLNISVTCWHFNREKGDYYSQIVL